MSPRALLIVDMQVGMSWPSSGVRNNPGAEAAMGELLSAWRARDLPRLHIRHRSRTPGSPFWPGQPGADFQPALAPRDTEPVIEKRTPDAFIGTELERWLRDRGIGSLVVVGVSTNNSVEATARSAGNRGFDTWVVSDATFAFAKPDFDGRPRSAEEVHAMALANLQGEYARVMSADEVMKDLARESGGDVRVAALMPHRWYSRPVLFVADMNRALSFYVERLGFQKDWHSDEGAGTVCQVSRSDCEIILCEDAARTGCSRLFVELTKEGLEAFRRELAERAVPSTRTRWGYDSTQIDDPDGNELLFPVPD